MSIETFRSKNVIVRKQRQCSMCLRIFPTNTKMNYWVGKYEGDFNTAYCCMACVEIMNRCQEEDGYQEGYTLELLNKGETPEQLIERWNLNDKTKTK